MRRLVFTGAVLAAIAPAAVASATTPPTDPAAPDTTIARSGSHGAPPPRREPLPPTNPARSPPCSTTPATPSPRSPLVRARSGFADYEEGNDPEAGNEYVRLLVTVESLITEGTFNVNVDDFILQSNNGFVTTAENVPTAEQAEADEDITEEADLANGESARPDADVRGRLQRRSAVGLLQPGRRPPRRRRRRRLTSVLRTDGARRPPATFTPVSPRAEQFVSVDPAARRPLAQVRRQRPDSFPAIARPERRGGP